MTGCVMTSLQQALGRPHPADDGRLWTAQPCGTPTPNELQIAVDHPCPPQTGRGTLNKDMMASLGATIVSVDHVFKNMNTRAGGGRPGGGTVSTGTGALLVCNEKGQVIAFYGGVSSSLAEVSDHLKAIAARENSNVTRGFGGRLARRRSGSTHLPGLALRHPAWLVPSPGVLPPPSRLD